ncbi:MAG: PspC domain-containing protein [Mycobacteriales bacterium]
MIATVATSTPARKMYRRDGAVAGIAAGLADHLRVDVRLVRALFVGLCFARGFGAISYLALWAVVPQAPASSVPFGTAKRASRKVMGSSVLPLVALGIGGLWLATALGLSIGGSAVWPLVLGGAGVAIVWREADDAQRARLAALPSRTAQISAREPLGLVRIAGGAGLLFAGIAAFVGTQADWGAVWRGVRAGAIVLAGVLLIFGPWWWRMVQDLTSERRERIRSQERVEIATHVHDSVLHTLALIQRAASDQREVSRLARGQERELRRWLYRPEGEAGSGTLRAALDAVAAEVEDMHAVTVEVIVVGDCALDEKLTALVAAAREALVNAAKHSGVELVSLYAEVDPGTVTVFVRDRGDGFAPDDVPGDRYGLAESVIGRMRRAGGTATVRSSPGDGAEVELEMTRAR